MNELMLIGIALFLLVVSVIDLKARAIPSILLTGGLFVVLALNQGNIFYGLLAFVLSYLLYEADFIGGMADIKVMTILGLLLDSFQDFMILNVALAVLGVSYKAIWKVSHPKDVECPFIPVFFFIFVVLIIGGII